MIEVFVATALYCTNLEPLTCRHTTYSYLFSDRGSCEKTIKEWENNVGNRIPYKETYCTKRVLKLGKET